jgi:hypothetical protein
MSRSDDSNLPTRVSAVCGEASFPRVALASAGVPSSCVRELTPSLRKTSRKWYWTVRGLMNSRAPISGFEGPSPGCWWS